MRRMITLAVPVLTLALLALAQAKPDFSGGWKLNISKSDFGALPAPESATLKIEHKDPALKMVSTTVGSSGERSYELSFTTDGKECTNWIGNVEVKSVLRWEGATLILEHKAAGGEVTLKDEWALSEDGRTLTITRHWSGSQGETKQTLVHEKQ